MKVKLFTQNKLVSEIIMDQYIAVQHVFSSNQRSVTFEFIASFLTV